MASKCKCGGYGYLVNWEADKIVRCRECKDCVDKKGYGMPQEREGEKTPETGQLDLFEGGE